MLTCLKLLILFSFDLEVCSQGQIQGHHSKSHIVKTRVKNLGVCGMVRQLPSLGRPLTAIITVIAGFLCQEN